MCLEKLTTEEPLIAEEDIIVYKAVNKTYAFAIDLELEFNKLVPCTASFKKKKKVEGAIIKETELRFYFLSNDSELDGERCYKLKDTEFLYSWRLDPQIDSITIKDCTYIIKEHEVYSTPFQNALVKLQKTYTSNLIRTEANIIEIGLHSLSCKKGLGAGWVVGGDWVIKCIIPKGSKYYEGTFYGQKSYASDTLKYLELCV